jgi:hypothetical protein
MARKPLQTLQSNLKKHTTLPGKKQISKDTTVKSTKYELTFI